ncbi:hypothetical protein ACHAXR_005911, partial [Thalassiosira sp. AJA248-18]
DDGLEETILQCAGKSYLAYESRLLNRREFLHSSSFYQTANAAAASSSSSTNNDNDDPTTNNKNNKKEYDLLTMSERKLAKLNYYQVLHRNLPMHSSTDDIRRAYHKACLKYHPDKTGRGEEDEVFLLVKAAFDTLSDPMKRRSYDSTVDFDESIPKEGVVLTDEEFYKEYGAAFERNMRFASFNDPARQQGNESNNNVHAFYDFWIHFDSWRDFTLKATEQTEHDVDSADCREEKRWMKQEIDRKVKKMKKDEMARVNSLVERAMGCDPRLKREKERLVMEKREREEMKRKVEVERAERERVERERVEAEMAKKKAADESKKKDAKIELLCDKLSVMELTSLNDVMGGPEAVEEGSNTSVCVEALAEVKQCAVETAAGAVRQSLQAIEQRNQARKEAADKARKAKLSKASSPWSKEELGALAKGVKKYPPGEQSEECIEKYNQVASSAAPSASSGVAAAATTVSSGTSNSSSGGGGDSKNTSENNDEETWTEEQDSLLQEMLRKYPADMGKNERWKSIAKGVPGRTKKECVQRFKAIREAVKKGKN